MTKKEMTKKEVKEAFSLLLEVLKYLNEEVKENE